MNQEPKRTVTVEDLLQLKRAERPPAEFWSKFERDLRAKQLAALVEKRPWWRTMPRVFAGFSRYQLPLGATAVLAITFMVVHDYQTTAREELVNRAAKPARAVAAPAPAAAVLAADPLRDFTATPTAIAVEDVAPATADAELNSALLTNHVTHAVALLDTTNESAATPSARSIQANLAAAKQDDPEFARRFLGANRGYEARALPARQAAVEPLAQMTSPADARRSRFVTSAVLTASLNPVPGNSEKIARRITDEQLYDRISRVDARGAGVLVKF